MPQQTNLEASHRQTPTRQQHSRGQHVILKCWESWKLKIRNKIPRDCPASYDVLALANRFETSLSGLASPLLDRDNKMDDVHIENSAHNPFNPVQGGSFCPPLPIPQHTLRVVISVNKKYFDMYVHILITYSLISYTPP